MTARERALAEHAGKLAVRERELDERDERLEAGERDLTARVGEVVSCQPKACRTRRRAGGRRARARACGSAAPATAGADEPEEPLVVPEPSPEPVGAPRSGGWNLNDLQHAVDSAGEASVEQAEEWNTYLYFLRGHAAVDGSLPAQFDGLVEDVFRTVVDRAR